MILFAILFAVLATSAVVLLSLGYRSFKTDPLESLSSEDRALIKDESRLRRKNNGLIRRTGQRLAPSLSRLFGGGYRNWVDNQIVLNGRKQFSDFTSFMEYKGAIVLLCGLGGVATLIALRTPGFLIALIIVGLFLPDLMLMQSARKRQEQIDDALPDFLDILAITVSAGLAFRSALAKVTERTEGPLAEEMRTVLHQLDMGETVYDAFTALRSRTTSDSLESFITTLLQAEELGAPLADTLETISLDMRQTTAQKARQSASKASPKIEAVVTMIMVPGTMALILVSMIFVAGLDKIELGDVNF